MKPERRSARLYYVLLGVALGLLIANLAPAGRVTTIIAAPGDTGPGDPGTVNGTVGPGGVPT
ncbi:MAG TPA: hypothetical protein VJ922_07860, partial [Actinomycetota bacterium]|nr:hypothetical protein [Actinomycetota bacterium]